MKPKQHIIAFNWTTMVATLPRVGPVPTFYLHLNLCYVWCEGIFWWVWKLSWEDRVPEFQSTVYRWLLLCCFFYCLFVCIDLLAQKYMSYEKKHNGESKISEKSPSPRFTGGRPLSSPFLQCTESRTPWVAVHLVFSQKKKMDKT